MKVLLVRPPRIKQSVTLGELMFCEPIGLEIAYAALFFYQGKQAKSIKNTLFCGIFQKVSLLDVFVTQFRIK